MKKVMKCIGFVKKNLPSKIGSRYFLRIPKTHIPFFMAFSAYDFMAPTLSNYAYTLQ